MCACRDRVRPGRDTIRLCVRADLWLYTQREATPNPHTGFGGNGAHCCIGANLARMTIHLMFNAVPDQTPDLTAISKPERLRSRWPNRIKHRQVDYRINARL